MAEFAWKVQDDSAHTPVPWQGCLEGWTQQDSSLFPRGLRASPRGVSSR